MDDEVCQARHELKTYSNSTTLQVKVLCIYDCYDAKPVLLGKEARVPLYFL